MEIKEITVKTALSKSRIPDLDYTLNPYRGCAHGCLYCYADFVGKYANIKLPWGEYVHMKINIVELLEKELKKKKRGFIALSTVCDPYQPLEKKYELSRRCLELISSEGWPVSVQTRSPLVLRDIDILKSIEDCTVGVSITTIDDKVRKVFEPNTPSIEKRLETLKRLKKEGLRTFAFTGPLLPGEPDKLVDELIPLVDFVFTDKLNYSRKIRKLLIENGYDKWLDKSFNTDLKNYVKNRFINEGIEVRH
ncbi:MAG: radical SAM protein [candidate division Zixibacteria bacterium]|nr:radical SAM protein [candidate division Zixibacteria bacterium]